ncbi:hypothetical protein B0H14DRAFT_2811183 [Mycena olivaceomarginata]|nr:hypothetical protein B0H14DRAFT_2811183 [Mycena olivaceomarginata]
MVALLCFNYVLLGYTQVPGRRPSMVPLGMHPRGIRGTRLGAFILTKLMVSTYRLHRMKSTPCSQTSSKNQNLPLTLDHGKTHDHPGMTNVSSMVAGNTRLLNGATPVPTLGLF